MKMLLPRILLLSIALSVAAITSTTIADTPAATAPPPAATAAASDSEPLAAVKAKLRGAEKTVPVVRDADGHYHFVITEDDGPHELTPDQFAARVFTEQTHRPWWMRLLNITSTFGVLWVTIGVLGQVLFTGRMIVQWLVSERSRRSVVPTAFWWMSLGGASMLLIYFLWRKDIVGVFGQSVGWFIYVRNLYFIHMHRDTSLADDPAPEAELNE